MSFLYFSGLTMQDNKELKEMMARWINICKYFFYVSRCCRGVVHDYAKPAKEDDYYNMVKVILCSIFFSFSFLSFKTYGLYSAPIVLLCLIF